MCKDIWEFTDKYDTSKDGIVPIVPQRCWNCVSDLTEKEKEFGLETDNFTCFDCLDREVIEDMRSVYHGGRVEVIRWD